jgi:hypothetical protein
MRVLWRHYADAAEFREILRPRYISRTVPAFLGMRTQVATCIMIPR